MILRENYADVLAHLAYRVEVCRDAPGTQDNRWSALRLLLLWADATPLGKSPEVRPAFPDFLAGQRRDGEPLAPSTLDGMISAVRAFYRWALIADPRRYRAITPLWIETLQAPEVPERVVERELYTLEDVLQLCGGGDGTLRERRIRAAAAFLFLSGMRVGAFVTLPIAAVDVARREVRQWTALGVRTKFGRTATTYLLGIPSLLDVVEGWDRRVRRELPASAMWYPTLEPSPDGSCELGAVFEQSRGRAHGLRRELRRLCAQRGIDYLSPHHFRHGHVVHAEGHARTMADRKAISENVMHSDLSITDGIYGRLLSDDRRERVGRLGGADETSLDRDGLIAQMEALLAQLKGRH